MKAREMFNVHGYGGVVIGGAYAQPGTTCAEPSST
jgi:hypothetical protein